MKKDEIRQKTFEYFQSGLHCAEAIVKAFTELYREEPIYNIHKYASGFGAGMGGSHIETCGALTGAIITIGWLIGRNEPSDDKKKVYTIVDELRIQFEQKFGSTKCDKLKELLGVQENLIKCKMMTADTAELLFNILQKHLIE